MTVNFARRFLDRSRNYIYSDLSWKRILSLSFGVPFFSCENGVILLYHMADYPWSRILRSDLGQIVTRNDCWTVYVIYRVYKLSILDDDWAEAQKLSNMSAQCTLSY
jgi:hypothetical protein